MRESGRTKAYDRARRFRSERRRNGHVQHLGREREHTMRATTTGLRRSGSNHPSLIIIAIVALGGLSASAATLVVDDDLTCPGATFTTIQAAVNAALPNDTIQVCAGSYPELAPGPLTINK